jgi:hypothetical protein
MSYGDFVKAFGGFWPGTFANADSWVFGTFQTFHFMGLCLLFGTMAVVDLRLLGLFKRLSVKSVLAFLPLAIVGFLIMASSGYAMVTTNPGLYLYNPAFRMKMYMVALAGINALIFTVLEHRQAVLVGVGQDTSTLTKVTAGASLIGWTAIMIFGRLLQQFTVSVN